jgi:hypothetical protein
LSSEVADLIAALRTGAMTLDDIADGFRTRTWPRRPVPEPENYMELAAAAQEDPETDLPGSFDEVTAAYDRGELTSAQYQVLSEAAADSINREMRGIE